MFPDEKHVFPDVKHVFLRLKHVCNARKHKIVCNFAITIAPRVAHVQFATDEADFDKKWPSPLPFSNCMNTLRATLPSSVCLLVSTLRKFHPLGLTESAFLSMPSVPPQGDGMSIGWG